MDIYDAIFYRKTIKQYSNKNIKPELMKTIKDICKEIKFFNKDLNIRANVVERGHLVQFLMGKKCSIKAPHYIVATSNKGDDYLQNIGFALEEIVLRLTSLGLATSWVECNLKREDILEFIDLETEDINENEDENLNLEEPVAIIAFGYPEKSTNLFRKLDDNIDRKNLKSISKKLDRKWIKILNAVRVAPSIKNTQPWVFYNKDNNIYIYEENQKKSIENMSKISMGIALKHFDLACKKFDMDIRYEKTEYKKKIGKKYFITAILNNKEIEN